MKLSLCSSSNVFHKFLKTISSGNDVSIEQSILNSNYNLHIEIVHILCSILYIRTCTFITHTYIDL